MTTATADDGANNPRHNATSRRLAELCTSSTTTAFDGMTEHIQRTLAHTSNHMAERFLAGLPDLNEHVNNLLRDAMGPAQEQINNLLRDVVPPVGPDWSAHITDLLNAATFGSEGRGDLAAILDQFDEIARNNPDLDDLVGDDPDAGLGEIGEDGLAFVAAEGVGLSWEVQRRMFLAFVFLVAFGALMTAVVSSEAASGLLEDAALPGSAAMLVLAAAARKYDQAFPRPEGDGEAGTAGQ
ncbi:hypothetical protein [Streptomyces anulatus]|uniref:hypothetical protein n=1 Tax=Streptomyces anulatus TaxID=1892 RepID=UPI002F911A7D